MLAMHGQCRGAGQMTHAVPPVRGGWCVVELGDLRSYALALSFVWQIWQRRRCTPFLRISSAGVVVDASPEPAVDRSVISTCEDWKVDRRRSAERCACAPLFAASYASRIRLVADSIRLAAGLARTPVTPNQSTRPELGRQLSSYANPDLSVTMYRWTNHGVLTLVAAAELRDDRGRIRCMAILEGTDRSGLLVEIEELQLLYLSLVWVLPFSACRHLLVLHPRPGTDRSGVHDREEGNCEEKPRVTISVLRLPSVGHARLHPGMHGIERSLRAGPT
ncbi:hypothetical protein C8Q70DRAFT_1037812 [Cubamyces menziesii]|nr:hypothetical protein C8Q70DRAFT_1037812 [Cubamyces menziesii]